MLRKRRLHLIHLEELNHHHHEKSSILGSIIFEVLFTISNIDEHINTFATMLPMFVTSDLMNWSEHLPFMVFSFNFSRQALTGYSPFALVYNREAGLPMDLEFNVSPNPVTPRCGQMYRKCITASRTTWSRKKNFEGRLSNVQKKKKKDMTRGDEKPPHKLTTSITLEILS